MHVNFVIFGFQHTAAVDQTLSWLKWETVYEFATMARADPIMIVASCILQIVWKVDTECCDMEGYVGQIGIPAADRQLARFPGFPCPGVAAKFIHPAKHLGKLSGTLHPLLFCWLEIVGQTAALSEGEVCTIPGKWGASTVLYSTSSIVTLFDFKRRAWNCFFFSDRNMCNVQ